MLEYFAYVKHSYIKAQDEIHVNFGYQTFVYGCESFKMEEPIIYSPGYVDTFAEVSSAFKSQKCILFSAIVYMNRSVTFILQEMIAFVGTCASCSWLPFH